MSIRIARGGFNDGLSMFIGGYHSVAMANSEHSIRRRADVSTDVVLESHGGW